MAKGDCLDQKIARSCGLRRACEDRDLNRIGGELIEQLVIASAPDDVQNFNSVATEFFNLFECARVKKSKALQATAGKLPRALGNRLASSPTKFGNLRRHTRRREKLLRAGIDQRTKRFRFSGEPGQV